jgi:hypothetical protein
MGFELLINLFMLAGIVFFCLHIFPKANMTIAEIFQKLTNRVIEKSVAELRCDAYRLLALKNTGDLTYKVAAAIEEAYTDREKLKKIIDRLAQTQGTM